MNNIQKRFLLFIFGCILIRFLFVYIAKTSNPNILPYLGFLALIPVIGWSYILLIKSRDTGHEVFGEKIWWNSLRPIHLILYLSFAISAFQKKWWAWIFLLIDVIFGLSSFLIYHFSCGNFNKLF